MTTRIGAAILLAALAGCGGGVKPVPVTGTIVYEDNTPAADLAGGSVVFDDGKVSAGGEIREGGKFTLSFAGDEDGAVPGNYKVAVMPNENFGQDEKRPPSPIAGDYCDIATTPLTATVAAGDNDLTLTVKRAKKRGR